MHSTVADTLIEKLHRKIVFLSVVILRLSRFNWVNKMYLFSTIAIFMCGFACNG